MHARQHSYLATYTGATTGFDNEVALALHWALERVTTPSEVLVIAPMKQRFRDNPVLMRLPSSVRKETMRTVRGGGGARAVVACWPTANDLDKIDSFHGMELLCVVPWVASEIDVWRTARGAIDLTGDGAPAALPDLDPVVGAALESITTRVNVSTGVGHPMDRNAAISAFRVLQRHGHQWTTEGVHAEAMTLGWDGENARDLAEIAQKVSDHHRFRGVTDAWTADIIGLWRERASQTLSSDDAPK